MEEQAAKVRPKYNMWRCAAFMVGMAWRHGEKKVLFFALSRALLAVLTSLLGLLIVPTVVAIVEARGSVWQLVGVILAFTLPMALCAAASHYFKLNKLYGEVTVRTMLIGKMSEKGCGTSYPNLASKKYQELASQAKLNTCSNQKGTEAIWETLTSLLRDTLGFGIYLAMLTAVEPWLMALVLVLSVTGYFISKRMDSYSYVHREENWPNDVKLEYQLGDAVCQDIAKDMRIFGMRAWINDVTEKTKAVGMAFYTKAENRAIWGRVADLVLAFLRSGAAYAYLTAQVLGGRMDMAEFLLYFTAIGGFTQWVTGILGGLNTMYRQGIEISTVREYLDYPEQFQFEEGESLRIDPSAPHEIRLEDVSYRYPGAEEDVLSHINLTIHPGEKLAVVGLNGAGKTTLVKLICGFLDPTSGVVKLDGREISRYNRRDYYKAFATVFQDFSILAASIKENVAQAMEDIDPARVEECLEKAGLTEKIHSLTEGMDTKLVREVYLDGVELSGGETQRLMLARALYKDVAFIVLDEPTAALDPIAEADMYHKYDEMTQGRLSVYISHRLASTRFCDRILFIQDHSIAEEGTHQQLLEKGGLYAQLFEVQSKYYREDYEHEQK